MGEIYLRDQAIQLIQLMREFVSCFGGIEEQGIGSRQVILLSTFNHLQTFD